MPTNYIKHMEKMMAKENAIKDPQNVETWNGQRDELMDITLTNSTAKKVYFDRLDGFCPYLLFVRFDALDPKDWDNGIADNSIYIDFKIDLYNKKVEVHSSGHIYLSPFDKATIQYKYLAMKSMQQVLADNGGKKFRKQSYKNMADLYTKMEKYYKEVMKEVMDYTGGYPYKQGIKKAETV